MEKHAKTNAVRILESAGIPFSLMEYEVDEDDLSGMSVARKTGLEPERVFKTLVAVGDKGGIFVFCIPVCCELDLKKAAAAAGCKRIEMLRLSELFTVTGYIRGGCSPLGMKKEYPVFIDESAVLWEKIALSAGARGLQLVIGPEVLIGFRSIRPADLTV